VRITFHYPTDPPAAIVATAILFHVCSWHTPQADLDVLNRQHPGQISHGLCEPCRERMEQEVA
jgi:hypothetical protein